jgi:hypothetical protein
MWRDPGEGTFAYWIAKRRKSRSGDDKQGRLTHGMAEAVRECSLFAWPSYAYP